MDDQQLEAEISTEATEEEGPSLEEILAGIEGNNEAGDTGAVEEEEEPALEAEAESETAEVQPESEPQELASTRLAAAAELESKFRTRELETSERHKTELSEQVAAAKQEIIEQLFSNPLGFAAQHEISPEKAEELALNLYRHKLGDDAPPELIERTAKSDLERWKAEQSKEMQSMREELQNERLRTQGMQIQREIENFSKSIPETMTYLQAEDPAEVTSDIVAVFQEICNTQQRQPTISECAQLLEQNHAKLAQKYGNKQSPKATTAPQTQAVETKTLDSDELAGRTPRKPDVMKSDEELMEQLINDINSKGFDSLTG